MINRACISLNTYCNLNCKYCYFYNRDDINLKQIDTIKLEKIYKVLDNFNDYSIKNITKVLIGLVGSGEPLLDFAKIKKIISYSLRKDYKNLNFYVVSNGYKVGEEIIKWFFENKDVISLSLSFDGCKKLQNEYRGKYINNFYQGTYDEVIASMNLYKKYFNKMPNINISLHKGSMKYINDIIKTLKNLDIKNITFNRISDFHKELSYKQFNIIVNKFKDFNVRNIITNSIDCKMYGKKCGVGVNNIYYSGSNVYPCGRFTGKEDSIVGNISDSIFKIEENLKVKFTEKCENCYYEEFIK